MPEQLQHKTLKDSWLEKPLAYQMGNIGSEVSRSLKNQNSPRFRGSFDRALELFDFTIESLQKRQDFPKLRELCRAREEFCDFFTGNSFGTDPKKCRLITTNLFPLSVNSENITPAR